ncbi:MAG: NUDIX hydrolase [Candidatus Shapirobacteria bacterium]
MPYFKVAAHGLIKKDGKFLITHRSPINDYMSNVWDIPGGSIDFDERAVNALSREIREEVNLEVDIEKIIFCFDHLSNPERHQFQLVYSCRYKSGIIKLNPEEHDDYKWVTIEQIKDLPKIAFLDALYQELK